MRVFTNAAEFYSCEATAAIFADGAVAGDPGQVAVLLTRRKREQAEREFVVNQLNALGATPTAEELSSAALTIARRGKLWDSQRLGGVLSGDDYPSGISDRVDRWAALFLNNLARRPSAEFGQSLRIEIARQQAAISELQASAPRPPG
ncbi:MAG TPA: hypothetical protein VN690_09815 [Terriglobales bacterium]|nr:hypothetical protein [Terriglobales bacterium]